MNQWIITLLIGSEQQQNWKHSWLDPSVILTKNVTCKKKTLHRNLLQCHWRDECIKWRLMALKNKIFFCYNGILHQSSQLFYVKQVQTFSKTLMHLWCLKLPEQGNALSPRVDIKLFPQSLCEWWWLSTLSVQTATEDVLERRIISTSSWTDQ